MIPGQGYQGQVYVSADGYGAAGPTISAQPELLAQLLRSQQRPGYQVYMNSAPQGVAGVPMTLSLTPERNTPERHVQLSPATATYNSPSLENFQKHQTGGSWEDDSVTWWTDMRYGDQQIVKNQFETGMPTCCVKKARVQSTYSITECGR